MSGPRDGGGAIRIAPARADQVPAIRACAEAAYAVYVPRIGREPAPMTADFAAVVPCSTGAATMSTWRIWPSIRRIMAAASEPG